MALEPLATTGDLSARKIAVPDGVNASVVLGAASEAVRDAAGTAIARTQATIQVLPGHGPWLDLHVMPVREVTRVARGTDSLTEWELYENRLYRRDGWRTGRGLGALDVDVDFGYDEIPADIVDLTCSLAAASFAAIEDGYDPKRGLSSASIDDWREVYTRGDDEVINPLELPERTRARLRRRFNPVSYSVVTR